MATSLTCDGIKRRDFLRVGAIGAGLSLSGYLRMAAAGEVAAASRGKAAIFINLTGGPSHMDTFDLKPDAPSEVRGKSSRIKANVPGVEISEHLPNLAKCADKFAIVRGVTHTLGAHELGTEYVNPGSRPIPSLEYPGYGAVVTKELGGPHDLPPFVAVPNSNQRPGFLGVQYAPLNTTSTPKPGQPYGVRGISLGNGLTIEEIERRNSLLADLDKTFAAVESNSQLLTGLDRFTEQAHAIITSRRAREAVDVSREAPPFAKPFGDDPFGMSCLLASRMIESGVRFVTLTLGGWDTHTSNFTRLKTTLLPKLDT